MATKGEGHGARILGHAVMLLFKVAATAVIVAIPVFGVWAGSSLATYANGPVWLAALVGVLAFPIAPLAWEGIARWRRQRKGDAREPILTTWDRVVVRTLVLNVLLVGAFLVGWPEVTFTALSTRGDWFLEGQEGDTAQAVRRSLLGTADELALLYEAAHQNEFAEYAETDDVTPTPTPTPTPSDRGGSESTGAISSVRIDPNRWPLPTQLHPVVAAVPSDVEGSIDSLGRYIAEHEPDPTQRLKALHDWVADRIAYDAEAFFAHDYPSQDAEIVFRDRKAVCAGYALLMEALGRAADVEIVYVPGDARGYGSGLSGSGHAWNAARIDDEWHLVDVTWDAGIIDDTRRFEKRYRTSYFLPPPHVFGISHFPDDPRWQLRETPISRGEFNRQPDLQPELFAAGMRLRSPDRSQVTVHGAIRIELENPRQRFVLADFVEHGSERAGSDCRVSGTREITIACSFPRPGSYDVRFFESVQQYGSYYQGVGTIEAISR